jgi:DNA-binding transcriptional LysR family regulator
VPLPDLNLLVALDILLEEGSVVNAARRMHLSAPAMSRTLTRIRATLGDPILVKIGRQMVPTPRALALRDEVRACVEDALRLLQQEREVDLTTLRRSFTLYANDVFVGAFGGALLERVRREAPHVVLRFSPESESGAEVLKDQNVDLYISAMRDMGSDAHVQTLFTTNFVGLARPDHPIFNTTQEAPDGITAERFASYDHISVSRRGRARGPIDDALEALGLKRTVSLVVPTFHSGVFALGTSDLLLGLPEHVLWTVKRMGVQARPFTLPMALEQVVVIQSWSPRLHHDPAHRWFRRVIKDLCAEDVLQA